jgi:hypothetical protein
MLIRMEKLLLFGFLVIFAVFWCFVCFVLAVIGGWSSLAAYFRTTEVPQGKAFYMQSGKVGVVNYSSCLTIRAAADGLYLAVFPLFRAGHPPLFIPWSEIATFRQKKILFWRFAEVTIGIPQIAKLQLPLTAFPTELVEARMAEEGSSGVNHD